MQSSQRDRFEYYYGGQSQFGSSLELFPTQEVHSVLLLLHVRQAAVKHGKQLYQKGLELQYY